MIRCRDASEADAPILAELFARSFTDTFGHLYAPEDLAAFLGQLDEAGWREELADPALAVRLAEAEGAPVAFAKVGTITLPVQPSLPATELRQLYVLKEWQGAGIAHELMRWGLERARQIGAREIYLSVYIDNHRARRFYERYGFDYCGTYGFRVGNQIDEDLIMRRPLEEE